MISTTGGHRTRNAHVYPGMKTRTASKLLAPVGLLVLAAGLTACGSSAAHSPDPASDAVGATSAPSPTATTIEGTTVLVSADGTVPASSLYEWIVWRCPKIKPDLGEAKTVQDAIANGRAQAQAEGDYQRCLLYVVDPKMDEIIATHPVIGLDGATRLTKEQSVAEGGSAYGIGTY